MSLTRQMSTRCFSDAYHCPVTFKVFNENSHIVAVRTTGNVFSLEVDMHVLYSCQLSREKLANFTVLCLSVKVFLCQYWQAQQSVGCASRQSMEVFSAKLVFVPPVHKSFLPRKIPAMRCLLLDVYGTYM